MGSSALANLIIELAFSFPMSIIPLVLDLVLLTLDDMLLNFYRGRPAVVNIFASLSNNPWFPWPATIKLSTRLPFLPG